MMLSVVDAVLGRRTGIGAGSMAPLFRLRDQSGATVGLDDFRGRNNVVVYFYPKDFSLGCTQEACSFRDAYTAFTDLGAVVLGISSNSETSHRAFAEKYRLPFALLSDPGGKVRELYEVPTVLGRIEGRVTYVIDKSGMIRHAFNAMVGATRHIPEALRVLKEIA
jgi:peroxiredoxin Q/BCP